MTDTVVIGDRIRISVALIKHISEAPDCLSIVTKLVEIREVDGEKVLVLERTDEVEA